jgi:hypothetical protein
MSALDRLVAHPMSGALLLCRQPLRLPLQLMAHAANVLINFSGKPPNLR